MFTQQPWCSTTLLSPLLPRYIARLICYEIATRNTKYNGYCAACPSQLSTHRATVAEHDYDILMTTKIITFFTRDGKDISRCSTPRLEHTCTWNSSRKGRGQVATIKHVACRGIDAGCSFCFLDLCRPRLLPPSRIIFRVGGVHLVEKAKHVHTKTLFWP